MEKGNKRYKAKVIIMLKQKKDVYREKKRNQLLEGEKRQEEQQTNKRSIMGQKGNIYVYAIQTNLENRMKEVEGDDRLCAASRGGHVHDWTRSARLCPFLVCLSSAAHGEDSSEGIFIFHVMFALEQWELFRTRAGWNSFAFLITGSMEPKRSFRGSFWRTDWVSALAAPLSV